MISGSARQVSDGFCLKEGLNDLFDFGNHKEWYQRMILKNDIKELMVSVSKKV